MGASCVLSLNSQLRRALGKKRILFSIIRRSLLMFIIGVILNSLKNNNIKTLRIPGVFQRLSFVYLTVALIELGSFDPEDNQRVYIKFHKLRTQRRKHFLSAIANIFEFCILHESMHGLHPCEMLFALGDNGLLLRHW